LKAESQPPKRKHARRRRASTSCPASELVPVRLPVNLFRHEDRSGISPLQNTCESIAFSQDGAATRAIHLIPGHAQAMPS
jgi:hypothetical protein